MIFSNKHTLATLSMLLLLFCCACSTRKPIENSKSIIVIKVNPKDNQGANLSGIIEITNIIPLETSKTCLIGGVDKIRFFDNRFYMFEQFGTRKALCFDSDGSFLFRIGSQGKAEGEYITIRDLNINPWDKRIELYDINQDKILYYNFQGQYCGYGKMGRKIRHYTIIDSLHYACFNDGEYDDLPYNFFVTPMENFKVKNPSIPFLGQRDIMNGVNPFYEFGSSVLFAFKLNDTIYETTSKGAEPSYVLDFGANRIPNDILNKGMREIADYTMRNFVPSFISHLVETSDYLSISYYYQMPINTVFYNKRTNQVTHINQPINDINYVPFAPPYCSMGESFVSLVPAHEIIQEYIRIKELKETSPKIINKSAFTKLEKLALTLNEDDNPVLMVYKLRIQ